MGGEFVEEYLQAALEPMIRNIAFDENNEVKLFSTEYAYQGLIGAITAGLLEAGPTVARNISNGQAGRGVNAARKADELIGRSLALDTKSEAFKLAGKLADGSILRNDYNVGELLKAYRDAGGNMGFIRMPNVDMAETSADTPSPVEETRTAISENNPVNMTDMVAPKMTPAQIVQSVQEEIGRNVAANPEGVQKTLSGGMSELIAIETRIKTGSGNINHQGIGIDSAHYEFMGYLRGEMALDTTAWTMAEAIKAVMSTQTLTEAETAQLQGLLTEIVGDAELAEAYVFESVDEEVESGYNGEQRRTKELNNGIKSNLKIPDYTKLGSLLGIKLNDEGYKIINTKTADQANADWADMGFDKLPIALGTSVFNVEAGNKSYSRVFCEGYNYPKSRFILRTEDIEGLSAQEIADKYALPRVPNKIVYVEIPENTPIEVSIVGPQEFNGIRTYGGDIQYAIKDILLIDEWFTNIEDLK